MVNVFLNGPTLASFSFIFVFKKHITILTTNKCKKCPSSIWCRDSNSRPLEHESAPITTRPGFPPKNDFMFFGNGWHKTCVKILQIHFNFDWLHLDWKGFVVVWRHLQLLWNYFSKTYFFQSRCFKSLGKCERLLKA